MERGTAEHFKPSTQNNAAYALKVGGPNFLTMQHTRPPISCTGLLRFLPGLTDLSKYGSASYSNYSPVQKSGKVCCLFKTFSSHLPFALFKPE